MLTAFDVLGSWNHGFIPDDDAPADADTAPWIVPLPPSRSRRELLSTAPSKASVAPADHFARTS